MNWSYLVYLAGMFGIALSLVVVSKIASIPIEWWDAVTIGTLIQILLVLVDISNERGT